MNIYECGWDEHFEKFFKCFNKDFIPAKVVEKHKNKRYTLICEKGYINSILVGKLYHKAKVNKDLPVVGDWVVIKLTEDSRGIIHDILPRKTYISRKMPISGGRKIRNGVIQGGSTEEQIFASNIDTAFIISGLDQNFDIRRLERYITIIYNSGVQPVIILNKIDVCDNQQQFIDQVDKIAIGISIHSVSALRNVGMDIFLKYMISGKTVIFLGSSGVGKSTIINQLLGNQLLKTNTISEATGKGRHTTTGTKLIFHESGCMVIDTPGSKELQLWVDGDALEESFRDIFEAALQCKFNDCKHDKEPGCAVKKAVQDGVISQERLDSYNKQHTELKLLDIRRKQYENYLKRKNKYGL